MAALSMRVLRAGLNGISATDPVSYASAILIMLTVFSIAMLVPTHRALRLDIARALHQE